MPFGWVPFRWYGEPLGVGLRVGRLRRGWRRARHSTSASGSGTPWRLAKSRSARRSRSFDGGFRAFDSRSREASAMSQRHYQMRIRWYGSPIRQPAPGLLTASRIPRPARLQPPATPCDVLRQVTGNATPENIIDFGLLRDSETWLPKPRVAGSNPVSRSRNREARAGDWPVGPLPLLRRGVPGVPGSLQVAGQRAPLVPSTRSCFLPLMSRRGAAIRRSDTEQGLCQGRAGRRTAESARSCGPGR